MKSEKEFKLTSLGGISSDEALSRFSSKQMAFSFRNCYFYVAVTPSGVLYKGSFVYYLEFGNNWFVADNFTDLLNYVDNNSEKKYTNDDN